jgi:hypothetical protein
LDQVKDDEMDRPCSKYDRDEKCIKKILSRKAERKDYTELKNNGPWNK